MNLEKTLEYINSLNLHGENIHEIIIKTDDWILVLGHLFGVAINTNESDKENRLCFDLEIIGEDTWSFLPNRGAYDEQWIEDKKEVYEELYRLQLYNLKYLKPIHIFGYKEILVSSNPPI